MSSRDPAVIAALEKGMELFNEGQFFEAHEVWETPWEDAIDDDRHFLQGLIQVAAGFYKLQQGQPAGTAMLLEKAVGHLEAVPGDHYGIDVEALLAATVHWQAAAAKMAAEWQTAYDADALPRLRWVLT